MPDIIDINISPVIETVALTIQPNLTTINVNTINGGGGAVDSVNTQTGVVVLNQDDILDGTTYKQYSLTEKNKLAGIAAGAEVNVNADWNAVSGDAQILNKPTIPTAVTQTSQLTNNGADGVNPFITALDIPTTGQASTLVREVKNMTGATLTKGTVVFISGANGNKPLVSKALATTDALSSRTFGLLQSDILNNGLGNCVIIGDLTGLDTSAFTEGVQLYLSGVTAGTFTDTRVLAPTHLVYVGKVTRSHPTQGQIEVGIQNGYELEEIHDVQIITPLNNQALTYETSTDLWKNKTIIEDSITDGVTTIAPSQNAVFDALATKFTLPSLTSGSVLFSNGSTIAQDNAQLFWDDTNNRLGIGATSPQARLDVRAQGALSTDIAFRVRNSANSANLLTVQGNGNIGFGSTFSWDNTNGTLSINPTVANAANHRVGLNIFSSGFTRMYFNSSATGSSWNSGMTISSGTSTPRWTIAGYGTTFDFTFFNETLLSEALFIKGSTNNVIIGGSTDIESARLAVNSTTQGFLPPRMTTTQKNAIASPAAGLVVYDSTLQSLSNYNGTAWIGAVDELQISLISQVFS